MRILIMAGGTGGHVFPALAIAKHLHQTQQADIEWLGTKRGIEAEVVPAAGFTLHNLNVSGLRGKSWKKKFVAPFLLSRALWQAIRIVRKINPDVVIGMGGFASGPGGLAAWLLKKPLYIHEQNAIPGFTNKILAKFSRTIFSAFPNTFNGNKKTIVCGNPIRADILAIPTPEKRFTENNSDRPIRILIIGGSLGAKYINELMPQVATVIQQKIKLEMWHQTGKQHYDVIKNAYTTFNGNYKVVSFIENMAEAYSWADLIVARAGAATVSEIAAAGIASILIPFPFAVDDHQTANANYLAEHNAAILIQQPDATVVTISEKILGFANNRENLISMAREAYNLRKADAVEMIAEQLQAK